LRAYIQRWSLIKNSAVKVSNERAIDAFIMELRRRDLVEEMGRIKPRTVSDLMDIANRFADCHDPDFSRLKISSCIHGILHFKVFSKVLNLIPSKNIVSNAFFPKFWIQKGFQKESILN
jgi:hypothetical protein